MGAFGSKPAAPATNAGGIEVPPLPPDPVLPDVGALEREMAAMAARTDALMVSGDLDTMMAPAAAGGARGPSSAKPADPLDDLDGDVEIEEDELEELEAELADLADELQVRGVGCVNLCSCFQEPQLDACPKRKPDVCVCFRICAGRGGCCSCRRCRGQQYTLTVSYTTSTRCAALRCDTGLAVVIRL
jgi:hypothetical protein